jgi:hypothetical protein
LGPFSSSPPSLGLLSFHFVVLVVVVADSLLLPLSLSLSSCGHGGG